MATTGELCARCKAPLTDVTVGAQVTCTYCGFVQRVEATGSAAAAAAIAAHLPRARRSGGGGRMFALAFLLLGGVMIAIIAGVVALSDGDATDSPSPASNGARTLRVAELAAWNDHQYHPLDAPGMPGSIGAVDPVAVLPWALRVARAWSPDAQIDQIQVSAVSPEGTVDARVDGASVRFGFVSPARRTAFANVQAVSEHPEVNVFFRIDLRESAVVVSQSAPGSVAGALPPPPTVTCATTQLLASARAHGLAARPHYDVNLGSTSWNDVVSWRWYVAAPRGTSLAADTYDPVTCQPL